MPSQTLELFLKEQGYLKAGSVFTQQIEFLNRCLEEASTSAIEAAKALLESVCKTIMAERGEVLAQSDPSTMELVKAALNAVGIREAENGDEVCKIVRSLTSVCQSVSVLRNDTCAIGHGRSDCDDISFRFFDEFVVESMNQIALVLLRSHHGIEVDWKHTKRPYDGNLEINAAMDRSIFIEKDEDTGFPLLSNDLIGRVEARPSEILYYIDRDAWLTLKDGIDGELVEDMESEGNENDA